MQFVRTRMCACVGYSARALRYELSLGKVVIIAQQEGRQLSYMLLHRFHREGVRMFPSICGIDFLLKLKAMSNCTAVAC